MRTIVFVLFLVAIVACTNGSHSASSGGAGDDGNSPQDVQVSKRLDSRDASGAECAAGGRIYVVYLDLNEDGARGEDETIVSSQVVCNGVAGADGRDGSDGRDGADGADGRDGAAGSNGHDGSAGAAGANGHSIVFDVVSAPSSVCAAGGSVILLALDLFDTGVYSSALPNQRAVTTCNGVNGSDAPISAYSPVEPIYACGNSVAYKEVLLRMQNGQVLGSFSRDASGAMTRLAFLPDGSFMNTDDSGCNFTLATSLDGLTRSISWGGSVQMTWPVLR